VNIPQQLISIYGELRPRLEVVEQRVTATLLSYSRDNMLPFIARIKAIDSAAEKIETGRYRSFSEIDDLVAVTLVVPTLQHEAETIRFCQSVFDIHDTKRRASARKAPDLFRFDATRLYGVLIRPEGIDASLAPSIYDIKFEIQIRTAFEHAWIVSTHPLTYKTSIIDWKRVRLAAQLKASTEQLDLSILKFEELASAISEAPWPEIQTRKEIVELIDRLGRDSIIPSEANPKDMSRFADNLMGLLKASKKKVDVGRAIAELEEKLRTFTIETFPRSASLLQVCMGVLCESGLLSGPLQKYSCHVTDHLVEIFPGVRELTPIFDYGAKRHPW
jgi:ppGpp synthetase/RelA/SpoT-type nucleotidyltranferase